MATYGSDILTGGTASASCAYAGYPASQACDDNYETQWWCNEPVSLPAYWKYDLGAGVTKIARKLIINQHQSQAIQTCILQGSNNDSDWDNVSGTLSPTAEMGDQAFTFSNSTAYRYYKVHITALHSATLGVYEFEIMEKESQEFFKTLTETLSLTDTVSKKVAKTFLETLYLQDTYSRAVTWYKTFIESITLADIYSRVWNIYRFFTETLNLTDTVSKRVAKTFLETLHLQDTYSRVVTWYRVFTETISLVDTVTKIKRNFFLLWKKLINLFNIEDY